MYKIPLRCKMLTVEGLLIPSIAEGYILSCDARIHFV
jgi:hypothetical protein